MSAIGRRDFLHGSALALAYGLAGRAIVADDPATAPASGLILRETEPENLEFPFSTLRGFITPNEQFYVRNHFPAPKLDPRNWRLKVEGAVQRPLEFSYDELCQLPSQTRAITLECAGNSRAFLVPRAKGVAWDLGAVSTAEWTGVPLAAILEKAGVRDGATEVILEGADEGEVKDDPKSPGKISFARSLPLEKARQPEVLLAYRMNGAKLPVSHGYPLRAVVGGWYGMASVKWLTRVIVTERPFLGFFQSLDYSYHERMNGLPTMVPITEMLAKAEIARPARGEVVAAGMPYRVIGAAWTGESEVAKVEVSADGGTTWAEAKLLDKPVAHAWRLWEFPWEAPKQKGRYTLRARATDKRGRTQAAAHDPNRRAYLINHVLPVAIEVR